MDEQLADKIDSFFRQYKHQTFKKGEMLIRADEQPTGIYYVSAGIVKKYAISQKGDEVVVNLFKPISFFPMSWVMNDEHNKYFYEALDAVEVWKAPKEAVNQFLLQNPEVMYNLLQRIYRGMEGLLARMAYLMSGGAYARLVIELTILAKRFGTKNRDVVLLKITEKDLAAQTGLTRETVSREIKILKEKGLITFTKNVLTIANLSALETELAEGF